MPVPFRTKRRDLAAGRVEAIADLERSSQHGRVDLAERLPLLLEEHRRITIVDRQEIHIFPSDCQHLSGPIAISARAESTVIFIADGADFDSRINRARSEEHTSELQ